MQYFRKAESLQDQNGFYFAHLFNQNILIGQIKAKAENLLKEKKSLKKSPEENKLMWDHKQISECTTCWNR